MRFHSRIRVSHSSAYLSFRCWRLVDTVKFGGIGACSDTVTYHVVRGSSGHCVLKLCLCVTGGVNFLRLARHFMEEALQVASFKLRHDLSTQHELAAGNRRTTRHTSHDHFDTSDTHSGEAARRSSHGGGVRWENRKLIDTVAQSCVEKTQEWSESWLKKHGSVQPA